MLFRKSCSFLVVLSSIVNIAFSGGTLSFESNSPLTIESGETGSSALGLHYEGAIGVSGIQFKVVSSLPMIQIQGATVSKLLQTNQWGFDYNIRRSTISTNETLFVVLYSRTFNSLHSGFHHDLFTVHYKAGHVREEAKRGSLQIIDVASALADGPGNSAEVVAESQSLFIIVEPVGVFSLEQNSPNPFNPTTNIHYQLQNNGLTTLKVFNSLGQEVATLANEVQTSGVHTVQFNGLNLSSGVYIYTLTAGTSTASRRLVLMK